MSEKSSASTLAQGLQLISWKAHRASTPRPGNLCLVWIRYIMQLLARLFQRSPKKLNDWLGLIPQCAAQMPGNFCFLWCLICLILFPLAKLIENFAKRVKANSDSHGSTKLLNALLLFEGILWTMFFPLDFEGKIHLVWMYLPSVAVKNCLLQVI